MDYSQIILELMGRIQILEKEVVELKGKISHLEISTQISPTNGTTHNFVEQSTHPAPAKRDTTRYRFENEVYLKNRLVLAVVKAYVRDNPEISRDELRGVFSKHLQGSIGVVEKSEIARERNDYNVRFFTKEDEIIHMVDGDMYVCTQWGILNIPNLIKCATTLGYTIETV